MSSITSVPAYKQKLLKAKEMQGSACAILYDRVAILIEVYNDKMFYEREQLDEFQAVEKLDSYLQDVVEGFLVLKSVFEQFPSRETWQKKSFRELLARTKDILDEKRKTAAAQRKPAHRVSKEDLKRAVEERDDAVRIAETAQETIQELRRENERLKNELAVAEYKIRELEAELSLDTTSV